MIIKIKYQDVTYDYKAPNVLTIKSEKDRDFSIESMGDRTLLDIGYAKYCVNTNEFIDALLASQKYPERLTIISEIPEDLYQNDHNE